MKNILFLAAYFCGSLLLTFVGILMLIATERSMYLLARLTRTSKQFKPGFSWTTASRLDTRIGGLLLAIVGVVLIGLPIYWMLHPRAGGTVQPVTTPASNYPGLVLGLTFLLAVGLSLLIRPQVLMRWFSRAAPYRVFPSEIPPRGLIALRLFGLLFILFSAFGLFQTLSNK